MAVEFESAPHPYKINRNKMKPYGNSRDEWRMSFRFRLSRQNKIEAIKHEEDTRTFAILVRGVWRGQHQPPNATVQHTMV